MDIASLEYGGQGAKTEDGKQENGVRGLAAGLQAIGIAAEAIEQHFKACKCGCTMLSQALTPRHPEK